jgi:Putative Actinobacterial Holin-X, holin superfamily III
MPNGNGERSPGAIVQDLLRDVGDIMRGEIRLAKAEIGEKVQKAGGAGGYIGAAVVCGLLAGMSLTAAFIALMALAMPVWLAAALMSLFLVCIAATLYFAGRQKLKTFDPVPQRTVETMRDNLQWAKHRTT